MKDLAEYKLVAPDIDRLLNCFERGFLNPSAPSEDLCRTMEPLFEAMRDLVPLKKNNEAKAIWVTIPRGTIEDFGSYEDMLECGDVEDREEYEQYWLEEYPEPVCWYELVIAEAFQKDGSRLFRAVHFGNKPIVNARFDHDDKYKKIWAIGREEAAIELCSLITEAVRESMNKLREGTYNNFVEANLPYSFRTGVIPRSVLWERKPEWKEEDLEGLPEETIDVFRTLLNNGANDKGYIGRLRRMTANDFFHACAIGYKACGYEGTELPPVDQYFLHGDGRDEGLSGRGDGLNAGPGIDFNDPEAWDEWYFHREQCGGHPWEVCRGGNSTHVDLYVMHDRYDLDFKYRTKKHNFESQPAVSTTKSTLDTNYGTNGNGFELYDEIHRLSESPIIFLTAIDDEDSIVKAFDLGADDYIVKPFGMAELIARVRARLRRVAPKLDADVLTIGRLTLDKRAHSVRLDQQTLPLTMKEYDLLCLLMENRGMAFSREQLLDRVWGYDYFGSDRVVDNHIKKLRKALGSAGSQIKTLVGRGYKLTKE